MRWTNRFILVVTLGIGGCATTWSNTYSPGHRTQLSAAPSSGQYDLYANDARDRVRSVAVIQGEPIGFTRNADGQLIAVAGPDRRGIAEGKYRWRRPGIPKETRDQQTANMFGAITIDFDMEDFLSDMIDGLIASLFSDDDDHKKEHRHHEHNRAPAAPPTTKP